VAIRGERDASSGWEVNMLQPVWKLWALLAAVVVGAASLYFVYFDDSEDGGTAPDASTAWHPAAEEMPELLAAVRAEADPAEFVGTWSGASLDKPGEGTSVDEFVLVIAGPAGNDWTLHIEGTFPDPSPQEVAGLAVEDGMLTFVVGVRNGEATVRLGVSVEDGGVLIGESTVLPGYDLADGAFLYLERCRADLPGC
jgi:hypothetical protein